MKRPKENGTKANSSGRKATKTRRTMARRKGTVGIIGLGIMGGSFARNLVKAGWRVIGFDVSPSRRRDLARAGVEMAKDPTAVAVAAPTIITSLPKPAALHDVVKDIAAAKLPRKALVEASTFNLSDKEKAERVMRRAGHVMLDCPMSGTGAQARTGDLVVYASGDSGAIARLKPMFAGFARKTYAVGPFGHGSRMKFVANLLVAIHNVAAAEAMVLGMKAGLDPDSLLDMVQSGAGNSRVFELRAPMMAANDYRDATMKCSVWQKDLDVIAAFAKTSRTPVPLFSTTLPLYEEALRRGYGDQDTAAVCAVLERRAKFQRPRRAKKPSKRASR